MNAERDSYSTPEFHWVKSSYSAGDGGECVEVARSLTVVRVRDSKDVARSHIAVGRIGWQRFVRYAAEG